MCLHTKCKEGNANIDRNDQRCQSSNQTCSKEGDQLERKFPKDN